LVELVEKFSVLAADRYIPLVATVEPEGTNLAAVAMPVVRKSVPLNVNPDPLASVLAFDA
jgi:hypothetical protein